MNAREELMMMMEVSVKMDKVTVGALQNMLELLAFHCHALPNEFLQEAKDIIDNAFVRREDLRKEVAA